MGVSECAYSALDSNQIISTGPLEFRVSPESGRRFRPVVAPYATALALMIEPVKAVANLRRLEKEGAIGSMDL